MPEETKAVTKLIPSKKLLIIGAVAFVAGYLLRNTIIPGYGKTYSNLPGFKNLYLAINKNQ